MHAAAGHQHGAGVSGRRRLVIAIAITAVFLLVEVVGAIWSGSLALLADAGHMLSDLTALTIALTAATMAARPPSETRTFGHHRVEVFAAFINAVILLGIVGYIVIEAIARLTGPATGHVQTVPMLIVAVLGVLANAAALLVLRGGVRTSINMRAAYLEVLGDLVGSVAVTVAAVVIMITGLDVVDVVASLIVAALIAPRAVLLLRDVVRVLSQATPRGTSISLIREHLLSTPGVVDVHDIHVWTLTPGRNIFTGHIVVSDDVFQAGEAGALLSRLDECLADHFDIGHSTFQLEPRGHTAEESPPHN